MTVVDTSAVMAVVLGEFRAAACQEFLNPGSSSCYVGRHSCGMPDCRGAVAEVEQLVSRPGIEIVAVTAVEAGRVASAHARWGCGVHRASLNFGDCFAYALAEARQCPLLFVGDDFARTDVRSALG